MPAALGRAVHPRLANVMGEGKRLRVYPKNVHQPWPLALKCKISAFRISVHTEKGIVVVWCVREMRPLV